LPAPYRDPGFQIIAFTTFAGGIGIPSKFSMIAIATSNLLLLIPYYVVTVRIEQKIVASRHPEIDPKRIAFAARLMNRITYAILAALLFWWLFVAIVDYQHRVEQEGNGTIPIADCRLQIEN
jgi:hypothetical protein